MHPPILRRRLSAAVLHWYRTQGRHTLPWRKTKNPYHIFVSEVMLQQTQVDRVIIKYAEFLRAFPTLQALADAPTAQVITVWKGLGYNRRALFLQKTAQAVIEKHAGVFPTQIEELKKLPGIGDYTARAILSFAFEQPVAMMDTNHRRFYQRVLFGLAIQNDAALLVAAETLLPKKYAYDWNQALMDIGSALCTTRKPQCDECPVKQFCLAYPTILTAPPQALKKKKTIPFKQTDRYVRGRIIDALREQPIILEEQVQQQFADIDPLRYTRILDQLEKDGLIKRGKKGIMLP